MLVCLLKRPVHERLGSGEARFGEIQAHAFFASLDFNAVFEKRYCPEFVPPADVSEDGSGVAANFNSAVTAEVPMDSLVTTKLDPAEDGTFAGFR